MKKLFLVISFLTLSACSATSERYFSGDSIPLSLIEPPYANNSKEWQDDIQQIIKLQKNFNLNELELASREKYLRPEIFILYADRSLTRESYPKLYLLFDRISITSKGVNDNAKNHWGIARPYNVDKRINMLITPSDGSAYPSGHTTSSLVVVQTLGMLIPQKSQDLLKLAKRISGRRVLVGMHYPHDIVAGEQLSRLILGGLFQNEEFKKDFENAKLELAKNPPKNQPTVDDAQKKPEEKNQNQSAETVNTKPSAPVAIPVQ